MGCCWARENDQTTKPTLAGRGTGSDENAKLYDDWAGNYTNDVKSWGYVAPEKVAALLKEHVSSTSVATMKILDAGGGDGLSGMALKQSGFKEITGIDISPEMVTLAKTHGCYAQADVVDLNKPMTMYTTNQFDAITCVGVMTYLDPEGPTLEEFCRVTKPGGLICYTNRTDKLDKWKAAEDKMTKAGKWKVVKICDPMPYLPNNPEFGTKVQVVMHLFRAV